MRFYGNGIVRLPRGGSMRFSKPEVLYAKGFADIEKEDVIEQLIELGYHCDAIDRDPADGPTKDELIEMAEALGIKVKGNWGVKKLKEVIKEAESENG